MGQNRKYSLRVDVVRFAPDSDRKVDMPECPFSAISDQNAPQQTAPYSITSSARSRNDSEIFSPSALAVLLLTTSSYLSALCVPKT